MSDHFIDAIGALILFSEKNDMYAAIVYSSNDLTVIICYDLQV